MTKKELIEMIQKEVKSQLNEAKFRSVKVVYSDGTHITTSMNPNITDSEIRQYFKVGQRANIGQGERDKVVTIKSVEILPDSEF